MCGCRVLFLFSVLILGPHYGQHYFAVQATADANENAEKMEPKLIEFFNARNGELTKVQHNYEVERISVSYIEPYVEAWNAKLVGLPEYKATEIKINLTRKEIDLKVNLGSLTFKSVGKPLYTVENSEETPLYHNVYMKNIVISGNVSITTEANYFLPYIYNLEIQNKDVIKMDVHWNKDGKHTENDTNIDVTRDFEGLIVVMESIFNRFKSDVAHMLEDTIRQFPLDKIFTSGPEIEQYHEEISQDTAIANKIVDDLCERLEKYEFKLGIYDSASFFLPLVLKDGTVKERALSAQEAKCEITKLRRYGNFNLYHNHNTSYLIGYLQIENIETIRKYTANFDVEPINGTMQTTATNLTYVFQLKMTKEPCYAQTLLSVLDFGKIKTHVMPEDTDNLIRWSQSDLHIPLVNQYKLLTVTRAAVGLKAFMEAVYRETKCNATSEIPFLISTLKYGFV